MEHRIFQLSKGARQKKKFIVFFVFFQAVIIALAFLAAAFWFREDVGESRFKLYLMVAPIILSIGLVATLVSYRSLLKVRLEISDMGVVSRSMFKVTVIAWDQIRAVQEVLGGLQVTAKNYDTIEIENFESKEEIKEIIEEEMASRNLQTAK
jgi:hypothetical protein